MKKIFIPVAIIVAILMIAAVILSKTDTSGSSGNNAGSPTYHVHEDGATHYGEH